MDLSVVIPVNNCSLSLKLIFQLLFYGVEEIIVMNNGNCDINIEGIKVFEEKKFSHSQTRNRGVNEANGNYIMIVSQDVELNFNPYKPVEYMKKNSIDAMSFRQIPFKRSHPLVKRRLEKTPFYSEDIFLLKDSIVFSNVCAIYKKSVLESIPFRGGYGEDKRWALEAINKGYKIVFNGQFSVFHSHPLSLKEVYIRRKLDREKIFSIGELFKRYCLRVKGDMKYLRKIGCKDFSFYLQSLALSLIETVAEI